MRTISVVLFVVLFLILSIPIMLAEWIIGKFNQDLRDKSSLRIVQWAFRCVLFLSGTEITVIGEENVPKDEPVLYIGNHRSYFDVVITYARVPRLCGYISKKEIDRIPLLHIWMRYLHCLFLDRDNIREGLTVILNAINKVKTGISICIFPEGTRNPGSGLMDFKEGSMKIAEKSGCPIIPVAMTGTAEIFEKHVPWVKRSHVTVTFGEPIDVASLDRQQKKFLGAYTRERILEMLPEEMR